MAQRPTWWHTLQASRREALLAVDLYNRVAAERSLEGFVVHMHLAWLYLFHARFARDGVDYRYRQPNGHFVRVDDEIKTWELQKCLRQAYPSDTDPVRCNVEFFIRIRNKIEHRYEELLAAVLAGKAQAHVLNFEEAVTAMFGEKESLAQSLRFPVFMSDLSPGAVNALKHVHKRLPRSLVAFIREFDQALAPEVQEDWRYDFRVLLLPQTGPKTEADAVMRFVREDEMNDEQREARDVVQTIVRNRPVAVQNKGRYKPTKVAELVSDALGVRFTFGGHHPAAWRHYKVRPSSGAARPELTDDRYCVWDEPHSDYLYTDAWVKKLVKDLAEEKTFRAVTGRGSEKSMRKDV